jgi:hypothetical protein
MPFIATSSTGSETAIVNEFWPDISLDDARDVIRIEQDVTTARLTYLLQVAMTDVNDELAVFTAAQQAAGVTSADDLTDSQRIRYKQAVYAHTTASLLELFQDYDATGQRGDGKTSVQIQIDAQRRQVATAIRAIVGKPRSCVELI